MKLKKICFVLCLVTLCVLHVLGQDAAGTAPKRKKMRRKMSEIQKMQVKMEPL